jgi:hypothetical protein
MIWPRSAINATSTWFWISSTVMPFEMLSRERTPVIVSCVAKLPTERKALATALLILSIENASRFPSRLVM